MIKTIRCLEFLLNDSHLSVFDYSKSSFEIYRFDTGFNGKIGKLSATTNNILSLECRDLDRLYPFVGRLKQICPRLELVISSGINSHLDKCPLCGGNILTENLRVRCECECLTVSLKTYVFSQIATKLSFNTTVEDENGKCWVTLVKTAAKKSKFFLVGYVAKNSSQAKLELRPIISDKKTVGYMLAVQVFDVVGDEKAKDELVARIASSFSVSGIEVMRVKEIL